MKLYRKAESKSSKYNKCPIVMYSSVLLNAAYCRIKDPDPSHTSKKRSRRDQIFKSDLPAP